MNAEAYQPLFVATGWRWLGCVPVLRPSPGKNEIPELPVVGAGGGIVFHGTAELLVVLSARARFRFFARTIGTQR